jgi:hypothetical protein
MYSICCSISGATWELGEEEDIFLNGIFSHCAAPDGSLPHFTYATDFFSTSPNQNMYGTKTYGKQ